MLRLTPMYRALHRPNLLMGGERKPVLILIIISVGLSVSSLNIVAFLVSAFLWVAGIFYLRLMAKNDPFLIGVYIRSLKYKGYYSPRSKFSCKL
ncbi:conjugal transfer protein TrbD [Asaia spathodeae]|uniref:VirB3 family type IV secretion system protein n=1 Tax=Asaia spathodeae TaxID=657016 RepID=A0ABX2P9S2_9PROT|nr:conjugal transfer protein TrbD [Asaia spathodeae]